MIVKRFIASRLLVVVGLLLVECAENMKDANKSGFREN